MNSFASVDHAACARSKEECNNGSFADYSSRQCISCRVYQYSLWDHSRCVEDPLSCEAGSYGNQTLSQCVRCDRGKATNSFRNQCITCLNSYALVDRSRCVTYPKQCESGSYGKKISTSGSKFIGQCTMCPPGYYSKSNACTACKSLGSYYYANLLQTGCVKSPLLCEEGTWANSSNKQCIPCSFGQISIQNRSFCIPCNSSTYASLNHTLCLPKNQCDYGTYAKDFENQCVKCSLTEFAPDSHSSCILSALECEDGFYANTTSRQCKKCIFPTYASSNKTVCVTKPNCGERAVALESPNQCLKCK